MERIFTLDHSCLYSYSPTGIEGHVMVQTVADNEAGYSTNNIEKAKEAQRLQCIMMFPSNQQMLDTIDGNLIHNCLVQQQDVLNATKNHGKSVFSFKGRTVRRPGKKTNKVIDVVQKEILRDNS